MKPGEYYHDGPDLEINAGRITVQLKVTNTGDRPVQVGSHFHFFEVNRALVFDARKPTAGGSISSRARPSGSSREMSRRLGAIAPVPMIIMPFCVFSSPTSPESPSREASSFASMLDTPYTRSRLVG